MVADCEVSYIGINRPITYLEWQCLPLLLLYVNHTLPQISHTNVFLQVLWSGVCLCVLCAEVVRTGTNDAVCLCVVRVGLSVNTQRPQELPRAERTASVCVLVPSKQGNLENTKGAANKHNLIPRSSCTWLWLLQHHSGEACLSCTFLQLSVYVIEVDSGQTKKKRKHALE